MTAHERPLFAGLQRSGFRPCPSTALDDTQFHIYCEKVKNITVSIDDETYRRARIAAAANDTSVTAMVRGFLEEITDPESGNHAVFNRSARERLRKFLATERTNESASERFERLRSEEIEFRKTIKGFNGGDRLTRDELYDRSRK